MSEKLLPITEPPIRLFVNHAYILSVLLNYEKCLPWIYSNYIQIYFLKKSQNFSINFFLGNATKYFYNIPFLEVRTIDKKFFIDKLDDIIKYIIDNIDFGYYLNTIVDEYYIPNSRAYSKYHYMHLIMVYGYNSDRKHFNIFGFDNNHNFTKNHVDFLAFKKAFNSMKGNNKNVRDHYIMSYKVKDVNEIEYPQKNFNYFDYQLDLKLIKESIREYLTSQNSSEKFSMFYTPMANDEFGFGIGVYDHLTKYFEKILNQDDCNNIDFRSIHGLLEHKQLMLSRVKYMQKNSYVDNCDMLIVMLRDIMNQAIILRNLVFKFNITKDKRLIERGAYIADKIKKAEYDALSLMLTKIN